MTRRESLTDEVLALAADLRRHAAASGAPVEQLLPGFAWPSPTSPDVLAFIIRYLKAGAETRVAADGEDAGDDVVANKAAFLWLSLQPTSEVTRAIGRASRRAFDVTYGALSPYLEPADLFELVRWKLWNVATGTYSRTRILEGNAILRYIATTARTIVIDQLRRIVKPGQPTAGVESPAAADPEAATSIIEELTRAVVQASQGIPPNIAAIAVSVLAEERHRSTALKEINRERKRQGLRPWSGNAFNVFLFRFRKAIRDTVRQGRDDQPGAR